MMESYIDIAIAIFMQLLVFMTTRSASIFFSSFSEVTNSILTILMLFVVVWLPIFMVITINYGFKSSSIKSSNFKHRCLTEDLKLKTWWQVHFNTFFVIRRLFTASILVFIEIQPFFQTALFYIMSFMTFVYLVSVRPLASKSDNRIEIFNEGCILLFYYCALTLINVAIPLHLNEALSFGMIGITSLNIIVNVSMVCF